jgi:F-type H+-transporting ATPase subunit b
MNFGLWGPPRISNCVRRIAVIAFLVFCEAAPAFAQEESASPTDSTIGWVFRWLNFALVFGGIAYALVKYATPAFRSRADAISNAIAEGARAREEAENRQREVEAKLAGLEKEIAEMRVAARKDTEAEIQRIRALAREDAQKIERAALAEIDAAERAARIELKKLAADLAIDQASDLLRKQLTPRAEGLLFRVFVEELERSVN